MTAAEWEAQRQRRQALDKRVFDLGYSVFRGWRGYCGHYNGCQVGLVSGADCKCREISAGIRIRREALRR